MPLALAKFRGRASISWLASKRPIVAAASPFVAGLCCNEVCDLRRLAEKVSQFLLQKSIRIGHTVMLA